MDINRTYNINVLGTNYELSFSNKEEDKFLQDCDGYCDKTTKQIVVDSSELDCDLGNPQVYIKKNVRHELIHAFMYESGLVENWEHKRYGQEETTVDWFAYQLPKINKALKDAELGECIF